MLLANGLVLALGALVTLVAGDAVPQVRWLARLRRRPLLTDDPRLDRADVVSKSGLSLSATDGSFSILQTDGGAAVAVRSKSCQPALIAQKRSSAMPITMTGRRIRRLVCDFVLV